MVNSLKEALSIYLNTIADIDPDVLIIISKVKGRKRKYIAKDRNEIHPDRPDLNHKSTYEFRPSWFVGTNYSLNDIYRILQGICKATGLVFSKDIKLNKKPS